MRVLQVDAGREMRGGQWQALRLAAGLHALGIEAPLLAPDRSPLFLAARREGLEVEALTFLRLSRLSWECDLAHVHDARAHTLAAMVCGSRFVVSRRVAFPIRSSWKYRRPLHFLAVSKHVRGVLQDGGVPDEKITVVYDGVPVPVEPARGDAVVVPASADPGKGEALAVEACRAAGVTPLVSEDLEGDLRRAALLVYLTSCEGLGSAVLLAMAYGVPVVASRTGGLTEIVEHGITGLQVDNDAASVAGAIRDLLPDAPRREAMAARAREVASRRFSVERMVCETAKVYQALI
jgi:hypothetical protein